MFYEAVHYQPRLSPSPLPRGTTEGSDSTHPHIELV